MYTFVSHVINECKELRIKICVMVNWIRAAVKVTAWIQQYSDSLIKASSLQQNIDQFMNDYDTQEEEEAERQKKEAEHQQEDEEGWVKVTKDSRGVKVRPHSETELLNFYTWQHRHMQKEYIAELRKKFEEDKQRIAVLRAQRKYPQCLAPVGLYCLVT
uniref:Ribosomal RNA processing 7 homolog A n=1 Tax=Cyprinus carpio TaxID=7962 RepID=A0A8C2CF54_CYPCA